eukprot:TRINITY_DN37516_c0_g1_i1.p1 TRINITY_DN37516_c0_g1~~TRINITY_DN37516_c0_g1_i1.p1  ORF type:complete len:145 (+),score=23.32 TRINITY_DN37516_c0_g1_i1:126-560(+)
MGLGKTLFLSTYEKELLALVMAVKEWRPYIFGRRFIVKTDQQSLKFLLEQRIGTPSQQHWVSKLLGYGFQVNYRSGKSNVVDDALSRKVEDGDITAISSLFATWINEVKVKHHQDKDVQDKLQRLKGRSLDPTRSTQAQWTLIL